MSDKWNSALGTLMTVKPLTPPESRSSTSLRLRLTLTLQGRCKPSASAQDYFDALRDQPVDVFLQLADLRPDDDQWQEDTWAMLRQVHPEFWVAKSEHPFFDYFIEHFTPNLTGRMGRWYRTYLDLMGKPVPTMFRRVEPYPVHDIEFMRGLGLHVQDCPVATTAPSYSDRRVVEFLIREGLLLDQGLMDMPEEDDEEDSW